MIPTFPRAADRSGHTLIELLTVLVLIAVIASLAAPSMTGYVARSKVRRALDRVTTDIAFARMAAVREGVRSEIVFTAGSYQVQLQTAVPTIVRTVPLALDYPGVVVRPPTANGRLVFDSRGLVVSAPLVPIVTTAAGLADSAVITAAGRVYRAY